MRDDGLHLTLRFLGETEEGRVEEVAGAAAALVAGAVEFEVVPQGPRLFPTPSRPAALVVAVALSDPLEALQARLERATRDLGFRAEERSFRPHITLARIRPRATRDEVRGLATWLEAQGPQPVPTWRASELVLYQSHLGAAGAAYTPLRRFPL